MIQITNEDNMDLMARYPDNYFDLAIVLLKINTYI
jgi:site-specific DNA-methyltransferase (adenine-specific)